jgi:flagellar protein FliL
LSGSEGTLRLRTELQRRVDLVIAPSKVGGVLIEEMLIN